MGAMELRRLGLVSKPARRGPQPHARAVRPRVAPALPPGPRPGRLRRGPRRREAPRVRRPRRRERLGRRHHDPLGVRADPRLRRRPRSPTASASSTQLRAMLDRAKGDERADRQAPGEASCCAARNASRRASTAPRDPGVTFEHTGIDYLIVDLCRGRDYAEDRQHRFRRSRRRRRSRSRGRTACRDSHRLSRKASRWSCGGSRPGRTDVGVVVARARSLIVRSAWM